jgi:hypothetical protein
VLFAVLLMGPLHATAQFIMDGASLQSPFLESHGTSFIFEGGIAPIETRGTSQNYISHPLAAKSYCGDGVKDISESCDGNSLAAATCVTRGYSAGALSCTTQCTFNDSACTSVAVNETSPSNGGGRRTEVKIADENSSSSTVSVSSSSSHQSSIQSSQSSSLQSLTSVVSSLSFSNESLASSLLSAHSLAVHLLKDAIEQTPILHNAANIEAKIQRQNVVLRTFILLLSISVIVFIYSNSSVMMMQSLSTLLGKNLIQFVKNAVQKIKKSFSDEE